MAGRGPAPKPEGQKRHRIADKVESSHLIDDGSLLGPNLLDLTGRKDWPKQVEKWFTTWRTSPQAKVFIDTDWQRLGMVAFLYEQFLLEPKPNLLSEIRLNEERLGATLVDRQRARMNIEREDESAGAQILALAPGSKAKDRIAKRTPKP